MKVEYFDTVEKKIVSGQVVATDYQQAMLIPRTVEPTTIVPLKEVPGAFKFLVQLSSGKLVSVFAEYCKVIGV